MKLTPYREVAKRALMDWNGMSEKQADEAVQNLSYEELENQCWATGSMQYAVDAIADILDLNSRRKQEFLNSVLAKDHNEVNALDDIVFKNVANKWKGKMPSKVVEDISVLGILSTVHYGWVKDNAGKFNKEGRENKRYQHLPLQLIGYKEATADLLFVEPILNALGVKVNKKHLESFYGAYVNDFVENKNLKSHEDLVNAILDGEKFYSALTPGKNTTKDLEVAEEMAKQVEQKLEGVYKFENSKSKTQTEEKILNK